jgi:hypothetical protein
MSKPRQIRGKAAGKRKKDSKAWRKKWGGVHYCHGLRVVDGVPEINGDRREQQCYTHPDVPDGSNLVIEMSYAGEGK